MDTKFYINIDTGENGYEPRSGSCSIADFSISGIEYLVSAARDCFKI